MWYSCIVHTLNSAMFATSQLRADLSKCVVKCIRNQVSIGFARTIGHRPIVLAKSTGEAPPLVTRLSSDMKEAMRAKDQDRLNAIRFLNAAIKSREIELRESGAPLTDIEVIKVLQKNAKQRKDSIESYRAGGRADLADKEEKELALIESYLPAQMSLDEVKAVVAAAVAELGASTMKDMGRVMAAVKARTEGQADNKIVSDCVKQALSAK